MSTRTPGLAPAEHPAALPPRRPLSKVDLLFKAVEGLMAAMLVVMLAMVLGNVILRYGFGTGITVSEEISRTLFVWITFVGAVVATREGTHLGVDSLVVHLPRPGKVACVALSELIILGCCVLIFWGTWRQHEVNSTTASLVTGMPLIWIFGVGYVMSLGIGVLSVHKLWRIVTGRITGPELFEPPATDAPAQGEGAPL